MSKSIFLQEIVESVQYGNLPDTWTNTEIGGFSNTVKLYDYQESAIKNAIKGLWLYYEQSVDWMPNESKDANLERKNRLFEQYVSNGFKNDKYLITEKNGNFPILEKAFTVKDKSIEYSNFINRMSFWMATGSGKTLVIIKIIEVLGNLIKNQEIPENDILLLIPRDDLIGQLKREILEYNQNTLRKKINLVSLKNYSHEKFSNKFAFENEITVFYYRADNLSDAQKDVQIDYRNYDNNGNWYVFLDEAHKGSNDDSKMQAYCSVLARNGFLFNFSATLIDKEDLATTVYNYNLKEYISHGYGKHILLSDQEFENFKENDLNDTQRKEIIIRSLITLAFIKKSSRLIRNKDVTYHEPMMVTLVNSVTKKDSDLSVFFRTLSELAGKNNFISNTLFEKEKEKIKKEIETKQYLFEDENLIFEYSLLEDISVEDMRELCFGSKNTGSIEVIQGKKELAFKLRTADKPFALIKIGDISNWTNEILDGYEITKTLREDTFFANLDKEDNISILMGSRAFFEGWDSLRPNVVNFINIGTGKDAKRYILQSIGRGVRLSPIKNQRMRAKSLLVNYPKILSVIPKAGPIETLFVYATSKRAVETVLETMQDQNTGYGNEIDVVLNKNQVQFDLLIPIYETIQNRREKVAKFHISKKSLTLLNNALNSPESVLITRYSIVPEEILFLKLNLNNKSDIFTYNEEKDYKNIDILLFKVLLHIRKQRKVVKEFKVLEDEILHFKHIKTYLEKSEHADLLEKIKKTSKKPILQTEEELLELLDSKKITIREYTDSIKSLTNFSGTENFKDLSIDFISEHYYVPVITSSKEKPDYIKHIISVPSEVEFISKLNNFVKENHFHFKWMFSKIDESIDKISIPYFSSETNDYKNFVPDFIFWIEKKDCYEIIFVDPKGTSHSDYENKIDGYRELFENKSFDFNGKKIRTKLLLVPTDINNVNGEMYKRYWMDEINKIFSL